jgi:AsmA protein
MQRAVIIVGLAVAIVVAAVLVFWATFDVNDYRRPIQTQLENRLGRPVTLGAMQLAFFPPRFQVDSFLIADDPAFLNPRPFIQAEQVGVSVNLVPLLRGWSRFDRSTCVHQSLS